MFTDFRQFVKEMSKQRGLTYAQIAKKANIEESTVKSFMCAANDSRRVAEKIADVLGIRLVYSNGVYAVESKKEE